MPKFSLKSPFPLIHNLHAIGPYSPKLGTDQCFGIGKYKFNCLAWKVATVELMPMRQYVNEHFVSMFLKYYSRLQKQKNSGTKKLTIKLM